MSEPVERYEPSYYGDMRWAKDGAWVEYADYARLQAEVERLRASSFVTAVPVEQYERVVKAGDDMADHIQSGWVSAERAIDQWTAAKEGKV